VLWIRIRKDPKLFAGSGTGSTTRGYGSGSDPGPGLGTLPKFIKKISLLIIMTLKIHYSYIFIEKDALKCHDKTFKIVGIGTGSETFGRASRIRIRTQNSEENGIRIRKK
jgi:hypothetical protein